MLRDRAIIAALLGRALRRCAVAVTDGHRSGGFTVEATRRGRARGYAGAVGMVTVHGYRFGGRDLGAFRALRIPIRTLAVAATDNGLLAPDWPPASGAGSTTPPERARRFPQCRIWTDSADIWGAFAA